MAETHLPIFPKELDFKPHRQREDEEVDDNVLHQTPHFHIRKESTHAELFYDLFFVANLTVFTYIHDVTDLRTLAQYILFFCIIWCTWFQVALYDVRFSVVDCAVGRIWKAFQFG